MASLKKHDIAPFTERLIVRLTQVSDSQPDQLDDAFDAGCQMIRRFNCSVEARKTQFALYRAAGWTIGVSKGALEDFPPNWVPVWYAPDEDPPKRQVKRNVVPIWQTG